MASRCLALIILAAAASALVRDCIAAQTLCDMDQQGFAACKPAATAPNPAGPSAACCAALSKANLQCLCSYKNSSLLPYMGVDPALAAALPAKCGIVPPVNC